MNFFGIGGFELIVIGLVAFLVLGPRKMAEAGKTAAKIMTELRKQRDELTSAILDEPREEPPDSRPHDRRPTSLGAGHPGEGGTGSTNDDSPRVPRPGDAGESAPYRPADK